MIFHSERWRAQLKRTAVSLHQRSQQQRWSHSSLSIVEQELMLALYSVRKLIEGHLTGPTLLSQQFPFKAFPSNGKRVSYVIWPDVAAKYELSRPSSVARDARFIANQFIHSFVFRPTRTQGAGLSGVFTVSDKEKDKRVFWFSVSVLHDILTTVAGSRSRGIRVAPDRNEMFFP